nr:sigma-70 family RNA polymerase sigma factor [Nocardioides thalensis]
MAEQFEQHRAHLTQVAYRVLGSVSEAEDAVQEAWLRLSRSDADEIDNLGGWLTTVVSRISLNVLRARATRRESSLEDRLARLPDPLVVRDDPTDPEHAALLADSVGIALLVVLDQLAPAERLAFVLHDMFGVPFDEIAPIVDRSLDATRQLASRARRRVRGAGPAPETDPALQRKVVDAFFAAADDGDFERLVGVLDPDVVLLSDLGPARGGVVEYRGAETVAGNAIMFASPDRLTHPAVVNGQAGVVITMDGDLFSVMAFTVAGDRVVEIEVFADPDVLARVSASIGLS